MKYKGFTMVPDFIVKKHGAIAGLVFGKIDRYCEWSELGVCTASNARLADELGLGESTIRKYKKLLEDEKYIKVTGKSGETDTVTVNQQMVLEMTTPLPNSAPPATKQRGTPLPNSDKESIKDSNKDRRESTAKALEESAKLYQSITGDFRKHLGLTPNWNTKTNRQFYEFVAERYEEGQTVKRFAEWWRGHWRGEDGSPPSINQVREFWYSAFQERQPEPDPYAGLPRY